MPDSETVRSAAPSRRASNARAKADLIGNEVTPDELRRSSKRARQAMDAAIKRLREVLETAKNPRDIAIAAGICFDKSSDMAALTMALEEHEVRVSEAQGRLIAEALRAVFVALGVPQTPAVGAAVREALEGAQTGDVIKVSPALAEAAAADVREAFGRRELPAPADEAVIDGQLTVEDALEATPAEEVTDAEVVDDLPPGWLEVNGGNEVLAREQFESFKAAQRDREQRRHDAPDGWRTGVGSGRGGALYELHQEPRGGPGGAL